MIEIKLVHRPLTWRGRPGPSKPYWTDRSTVDKDGLEKGVQLYHSGYTKLTVVRDP
jgi:hypothetical protein